MWRCTRVLILTEVMAAGGIERAIQYFLHHFDKSQIEPILLTIHKSEGFYDLPKGISVQSLADQDLPPNYTLAVEIPLQWFAQREDFVWLNFVASKLANFSRNNDVQLILTCNFITTVIASLARQQFYRDVRVVGTIANHLSAMVKDVPHGPLYAWLAPKYLSNVERIVALNHSMAQDLHERWGIPRGLIRVIPCPIDLGIYDRSEDKPGDHDYSGVTEVEPFIVFIGRLVPQKNVGGLLRAMSKVLEQASVRLLIIGDGPLKGSLEKLAQELGVGHHVTFLGFQKNPAGWLRRASALVLPSFYEGFANVILEALACGCPVISTDCPSGPAEILQNGKYGILVPVGDENALAEAILKLLADQALRNDLSNLGPQRAKDFDAPKIVRQYEDLILEVLGVKAWHLRALRRLRGFFSSSPR